MNESDSVRIRFGIRFSLLTRQWRRVIQAHLASSGMTDTSWVPLVHLHERHLQQGDAGPGITLKDLATLVGVESSSLVRIIDKLAREGLVVRQRDETDGRAKLICLTDEGKSRVEALRAQLSELDEQILADVSDAEVELMSAALKKIQIRLTRMESPPSYTDDQTP